MKTHDLQRNILSSKNELFTKYHIKSKEADELAASLEKYNTNLDPKDLRDLKKGLEKTMKTDHDSGKKKEAGNKFGFFQSRGAIKP